jgi:hypothetical protein
MEEMNLAPAGKDQLQSMETISLDECAPVGTFAGTKDFIIRVRDGQPAPANTGDQGGGQN